ncbi:hypothetical protein [Natrinema longum]|uniref:Sulfatase n=1 Tax=Natrinema longum TaxID=370324 RepID=A0A8A2UCM2_9EURY|nr:hypothetical protein [Natrinema longum]MBZ6496466.1 hypothetical protein [Natrinema longum]QSW85628.1 hypothetical protein J0X27_01935 [Natrinema longum]
MTPSISPKSIVTDARKAIKNPERVRRRIRQTLARSVTSRDYTPVESYYERDWDTLVILDACRFDTFRDTHQFDGTLERIQSNASHTSEFLEKNFSDDQFDIAYVSASPQLVGYEDTFAHVEHVWSDQWNDELDTVTPDTVTHSALEIAEEYPQKRLIVHYMQPHYPFIGETGRDLGPQASFTGGLRPREGLTIWERMSAGEIDSKTARKAYRENLKIVLPHVQELTESIDGKTVVTSDHGNLFGKRISRLPLTIYGHPPRFTDRELTSVPWLELPYEDRRTITTADEAKQIDIPEQTTDRLEALGYR